MKWIRVISYILNKFIKQAFQNQNPKNILRNIIRENLNYILLASVSILCISFWISISISLIFLNISLQYEQLGNIRLNAELVGAGLMIVTSLILLMIIKIWGNIKFKQAISKNNEIDMSEMISNIINILSKEEETPKPSIDNIPQSQTH